MISKNSKSDPFLYTADQPLLSKKEKNRLEQLKRKYANNKEKQNNQLLSIETEKYQNLNAQNLKKQKQKEQELQRRSAQNYQVLLKKIKQVNEQEQQNKEQYRPTKHFFQQQSSVNFDRSSNVQAKAQNKISTPKNQWEQNKYVQDDKANNSPKITQFLLKSQLDQFKGKVFKVNSNIQFKLDSLQRKLNELRSQNKNQNQCFSEKQKSSKKLQQRQNFISPYIEQKNTFACSSPKITVQRSKLAQYTTQLAHSEIIQLQAKNEQKQIQFIFKKRQNLKQLNLSDQINEINQHQEDITEAKLKIDVLQLKGKFQRKVSKDFTTFINRLSHQIQIDTEFTANLANYNNIQVLQEKQTKNLLKVIRQKVKSMTCHYPMTYQDEILQISQMQIDPLQNIAKPQIKMISSQQILSSAMKIRDEYIKVQEFFYRKLHKKFKIEVIDILIEELKQIYSVPQNGINIGHLASYLNMRTGSEFRNRNFFKLLKRLKIQENILKIDKRVLKQLFLVQIN